MSEGFGIIPEDTTSTTSTPEQYIANKLYNFLRTNNLLDPSTKSAKKWHKDIKPLFRIATATEIEEVLDWYFEHHKDKYCPKIYSARRFKEKFNSLTFAMESQYGSTAGLPKVEVIPIIHKISKNLALEWPLKEKKDELQFLQHSYNNMKEMDRKMVRLYRCLRDYAKMQDAALGKGKSKSVHWADFRVFEHAHFSVAAPDSLTKWWALIVNESAWKWRGWTGNLMAWVLREDNRHLDRLYSEACNTYRMDADWWKFKEMLKEIE